MSPLRSMLREYLAVRRALGFKLYSEGQLLKHFVDFAERLGATYITTDLALKWASDPAGAPARRRARRLSLVRHFARFASASDSRTVVPPENLIPYRYRRIAPYIYRDDEVHRLLTGARKLRSSTGLRPHTYVTLLGLYAAAGLRPGEPLRMDREDVDLIHGVLTIRESKFGRSRLVPVHASTQRALQRYADRRNRVFRCPHSESFFLCERGTRVSMESASTTFSALVRQIRLSAGRGRRPPRIYDLRHRFAITTLTEWHRRGEDVGRRLPELSTDLGHSSVANTHWYLTATPEFLRHARWRAERSPPIAK